MVIRLKVVFFFAVCILLQGCAGSVFKPVAPEVEITNIKISSVSFPLTNVLFSIEVSNPNDFDIQVAYIDMEFHVMDYLITSENWSNIEVLHSHQTRSMQVPVKVDLLNSLALLPYLMSETKVPYMISGTVKLENYRKEMPFKYKGDFTASQMNSVTRNNKHANPEKRAYLF